MPVKDYCRENALSKHDLKIVCILIEECAIYWDFSDAVVWQKKEKKIAFMGEENKAIEMNIKGN